MKRRTLGIALLSAVVAVVAFVAISTVSKPRSLISQTISDGVFRRKLSDHELFASGWSSFDQVQHASVADQVLLIAEVEASILGTPRVPRTARERAAVALAYLLPTNPSAVQLAGRIVDEAPVENEDDLELMVLMLFDPAMDDQRAELLRRLEARVKPECTECVKTMESIWRLHRKRIGKG